MFDVPRIPPSSKQDVSSQHRHDDRCQNAGLATRASIFARRKAPLSHGVTSKRSLLCDRARLLVCPPPPRDGSGAERSSSSPAALGFPLPPSPSFPGF